VQIEGRAVTWLDENRDGRTWQRVKPAAVAAFDSFDGSPLGAFIESPLQARGYPRLLECNWNFYWQYTRGNPFRHDNPFGVGDRCWGFTIRFPDDNNCCGNNISGYTACLAEKWFEITEEMGRTDVTMIWKGVGEKARSPGEVGTWLERFMAYIYSANNEQVQFDTYRETAPPGGGPENCSAGMGPVDSYDGSEESTSSPMIITLPPGIYWAEVEAAISDHLYHKDLWWAVQFLFNPPLEE